MASHAAIATLANGQPTLSPRTTQREARVAYRLPPSADDDEGSQGNASWKGVVEWVVSVASVAGGACLGGSNGGGGGRVGDAGAKGRKAKVRAGRREGEGGRGRYEEIMMR